MGDRDRALSLLDPEIELRSATERETYRGLDGMVRYMEEVGAVIEDFHFEDARFIDAGKGRVVRVRNGRMLKGEIYRDQPGALDSAGLSGDGRG